MERKYEIKTKRMRLRANSGIHGFRDCLESPHRVARSDTPAFRRSYDHCHALNGSGERKARANWFHVHRSLYSRDVGDSILCS